MVVKRRCDDVENLHNALFCFGLVETGSSLRPPYSIYCKVVS